MTKRYVDIENNGNIQVPESIQELNNIATSQSDEGELDSTHVIVNMHEFGIKLVHIINTEDEINETKDISKEVKEYSRKTSQEFMEQVNVICAEAVVNFIKTHPQFRVKSIRINSNLMTGNGFMHDEIKDYLLDSIGG